MVLANMLCAHVAARGMGGQMKDRIIQGVSSGPRAWVRSDSRRSDSLRFMSTCPNCKGARFQRRYEFRTLVTLLVDNQPIEAHCAACDEFWPINASERAALAWLLLTD